MEALNVYDALFLGSLFAVWALLFFFQSSLRREMLTVGLFSIFLLPATFTLGAVQGDVSQLNLWDTILTFLIASLAAVCFHSVFGKHYHRLPTKPHTTKEEALPASAWFLKLFLMMVSFSWLIILAQSVFNLSTALAMVLAAVIIAFYMILYRKDLLMDAVWSALFTGVVVCIAALIAQTFGGSAQSALTLNEGPTVFGIPTSLILWSLALGIALGPLYEYARRLRVDT